MPTVKLQSSLYNMTPFLLTAYMYVKYVCIYIHMQKS